jgi:basic amino acid/polyamine antiporter, APA family
MAHRETRNFFLVYLAGGIVLYFAYGMWNSKLGKGVVVHGHEVMAETPHPKGLDR